MNKKKDRKPRIGSGLLSLGLIALIFFAAQGCGTNKITLAANPAGSANLSGSGRYEDGQEVTISALPADGWEFAYWSQDGEIISETSQYTFTVQGGINMIAHLKPVQYAITALAQGNGSVVYPDGALHGHEIAVKAVPESGYRFVYWTEEGEVVSTEAEYSFAANANRQLTAVFLPEQFVAGIEVEGEGVVEESWTTEPVITVALKAIPRAGYEFFGWVDLETDQEVETNTVFSFAWSGPRKLLARFRKELVSVDGGSLTAVVGKQTTIGRYEPEDLVVLPTEYSRENKRVRREVAEALALMYHAAQADGVKILVHSAYRSYDTQYGLFYRYAETTGVLAAERYSARPGQSEHQLGTAVDFGGTSKDYSSAFFNTAQGTWLFNNAHKFGFALSYPKDSEAITGYIYEPWHYRYVGVDLAVEWKDSGQTLIEFLSNLNQAN